MQNWDTRIKNLKTDIEIARQKYVVPFIKAETKVPPVSKEVNQNPIPTEPSLDNNVQPGSEKLYENKDPNVFHYTMDGVLYKYTYNNNHNKFIDFINYITLEPSSFLYNREKYIESFCHIQKIYHAFIKFKKQDIFRR